MLCMIVRLIVKLFCESCGTVVCVAGFGYQRGSRSFVAIHSMHLPKWAATQRLMRSVSEPPKGLGSHAEQEH